MNIPECTIDGCIKAQKSRGLCSAHYGRFRRHGDPLRGGNIGTSPGVPERFYKDTVLTFDSDECLVWTFARFATGYASISGGGYVHRMVCEAAHGSPPTPEHQAAHSCGNRPCVNRKHLSWKTQAENELDKIQYGTMPVRQNGRWVSVLNL